MSHYSLNMSFVLPFWLVSHANVTIEGETRLWSSSWSVEWEHPHVNSNKRGSKPSTPCQRVKVLKKLLREAFSKIFLLSLVPSSSPSILSRYWERKRCAASGVMSWIGPFSTNMRGFISLQFSSHLGLVSMRDTAQLLGIHSFLEHFCIHLRLICSFFLVVLNFVRLLN